MVTGRPGQLTTCLTQVRSTESCVRQQTTRLAVALLPHDCSTHLSGSLRESTPELRVRCVLCPAGWRYPAESPPRSPLTVRTSGSFRQLGLQHMSPIAQRFRQAAADGDVILEPGSKAQQQTVADEDTADEQAACTGVTTDDHEADTAGADALSAEVDPATGAEMLVVDASEPGAGLVAEGSVQQEQSVSMLDADIALEHSTFSVSSIEPERRAVSKQQSQPRQLWSARGSGNGSRPSSAQGSRPGSASNTGASNSRRSSAQETGGPLRKQSSSTAVGAPVPSYAAGTRSSSAKGAGVALNSRSTAGASRQPGCPPASTGRARAASSTPQTAGKVQ